MNLDRSFFAIVCRHGRDHFVAERRLGDACSRAETVRDILTGQVEDVERVIEFNPAEGTSRDVSEDIAHEIARLAGDRLAGGPVAGEPVRRRDLRDFLEQQLGVGTAIPAAA
ncbi:MAG TPA: hypothetical protein VGH49_18615 [Xanthobacteraceae bacterium]|jgi:hypothetical protein